MRNRIRFTCSVTGCRRNSTKDGDHVFFRLPADPNLRALWIQFTGSTKSPKKIHVCSDHFEKKYLWQKSPLKLMISNAAIPTIPPITSGPPTKSSKGVVKFQGTPKIPSPAKTAQVFYNDDFNFASGNLNDVQMSGTTGSEQIWHKDDPNFVSDFADTNQVTQTNNEVQDSNMTKSCSEVNETGEMSDNKDIQMINEDQHSVISIASSTPSNVSGHVNNNQETQVNNGDQHSDVSNFIENYTPGQLYCNQGLQANCCYTRSTISDSNSNDNIVSGAQAAVMFFVEIENQMNIKIPTYLKNALICTGYDNEGSLRGLTDGDFEEIQDFVRNHFETLFSGDNILLEEYMGIFSRNIQKFRILPGHKKLLLSISKFLIGRHCDNSSQAFQEPVTKLEI